MKYILITLLAALLIGCSKEPTFDSGDFIMQSESENTADILKIVAVGKDEYKVFTHFISDGKLIQAEDYQTRPRKQIEEGFIEVAAPLVNDSFSPDKYLSE